MNKGLIVGAGLAVALAGGVAMAQAPNQDQGGQAHEGEARRGPMGGHMGEHMGDFMRMHMQMQPPSKAAHFRFRRGDAMVDIKCADDEPMKACVDAGTALLDKLAPTPK